MRRGDCRRRHRPSCAAVFSAHPPVDPGHHDQRVAGEEFRSRHDDEDQSRRKDQPAKKTRWSVREIGARHGRGEACRTQRDEGPGQKRQCEERHGSKLRLADACLLDPQRHFRGLVGVKPGGVDPCLRHACFSAPAIALTLIQRKAEATRPIPFSTRLIAAKPSPYELSSRLLPQRERLFEGFAGSGRINR